MLTKKNMILPTALGLGLLGISGYSVVDAKQLEKDPLVRQYIDLRNNEYSLERLKSSIGCYEIPTSLECLSLVERDQKRVNEDLTNIANLSQIKEYNSHKPYAYVGLFGFPIAMVGLVGLLLFPKRSK